MDHDSNSSGHTDGDVFPLNPPKLEQLLPKCLDKDRHTRRSARIEKADAGNFFRLRLRPCYNPG